MKAFLICCLFFGKTVSAQFYNTTIFTTKSGLTSNNINYVLKDTKGFLWIATNNGLNRYDGNRFVKFQKSYSDSTSIGSNFIVELLEGENGQIWANFESGFSVWQPEIHQFKNFYLSDFFPARNEKLVTIKNWDKDFLLMATNKSIYLFHTRKHHFFIMDQSLKTFSAIPLADFSISSVLPAENKSVWVCCNGKLFKVNTITQAVESYQNPTLSASIGAKLEYADNAQHQLYISSYNKGLFIFDWVTGRFTNKPVVKNTNPLNKYDPLYSFQPFGANQYIYNTELNVGVFDAVKLNFTSILTDSLFAQSVVRQMITDKFGNIWIATSTGLMKAAKAAIDFHILPKPSLKKGSFATVQCLPEQPYIFTSVYNDPYIYKVQPETAKYTKLPAQNGFVKGVLRYIFPDSKNNLWLSTENEVYLLKNNAVFWQKIPIAVTADKAELLEPRNFAEDKNGKIWLRIRNSGLYFWDSNRQSFQNSGMLTYNNGLTFSGMVYNAKENGLWIAETLTGLFKVDISSGKVNYISFNENISQRNFERIASNNDSILWISDAFNGIFKYNLLTRAVKHYNTNSGLGSNSNELLQFDANGNVWTFSSEGVSVIHPVTHEVVNLQHPFLTRIQNIAIATDQKIYVATNTAIYWWNISDIFKTGNKNKLYWDYATVNNRVASLDAPLQLNPSQNDLSLYFGVMNEGETIPFNLQYKFVNETDWINLKDKSSLSFYRLSPGNYTVQIRLQEETDPSKWLIAKWTIKKPFWQTITFWILLFLATGLLLWYFFKQRIQSVRKKAALQQQITELETQALRAQMNPHFIFNCISSIDNFILEKDAQNASAYLNKFAKLIRNILDNSTKEVIPFWKDWETLLYYIELERLRNNHSFLCTAEADEAVLNGHYKIPPLIIQPYVENAIHHGIRPLLHKQGHLKIMATLKNNVLEYTIEDNGVGRNANAQAKKSNLETEHYSYGMQLSKKRIDLFNEQMQNAVTITDLLHEDGTAAGTKVTVILKV